MDPRPGQVDPLTAVQAELDDLDSRTGQEQIAAFGRIHAGLAAALAGTAAESTSRPPGR